ncbi:MAG: radical SAM protein [Candidatus Paceibacterota bacterium]|jgi:radical SAM protein with 4Fe4S-binding SPASM domain
MQEKHERKPHFETDGIHHATIRGHRFHLRLKDPISDNYLWIDGKTLLVIGPRDANFVRYIIEAMWKFLNGEGDRIEEAANWIVDQMKKMYPKVNRRRIRKDLDRIFDTLMAIAESGCPVEVLGEDDVREVRYDKWVAPARMDLAVTGRCNLNCGKCYRGGSQIIQELDLDAWRKAYGILWNAGVHQIVFTGGEPTLRDDIVKLVSEADEFVTGLVTNGTNLEALAEELFAASLDYVQVTIESWTSAIHDAMTNTPGSHVRTVAGIKKALEVGLSVSTNTTLTKQSAAGFLETIRFLHSLGVKHVACNSLICSGRGTACKIENGLSDQELAGILEQACELADELGMEFQWYSPTCYTLGVNPIDLGLGVKTCSAASYNMTIEPNGSVLPCQSWPESVGNILVDDWKKIWEHPVCVQLRNHAMKALGCGGCAHETTCAGGCPLDKTPRQKTTSKKECA